jgi:hypothetical protein
MRQLDEGFVIEMVTCPGVQMTVSAQMAEPRTRSC